MRNKTFSDISTLWIYILYINVKYTWMYASTLTHRQVHSLHLHISSVLQNVLYNNTLFNGHIWQKYTVYIYMLVQCCSDALYNNTLFSGHWWQKCWPHIHCGILVYCLQTMSCLFTDRACLKDFPHFWQA